MRAPLIEHDRADEIINLDQQNVSAVLPTMRDPQSPELLDPNMSTLPRPSEFGSVIERSQMKSDPGEHSVCCAQ
jgi:hypothetical protein